MMSDFSFLGEFCLFIIPLSIDQFRIKLGKLLAIQFSIVN